MAKNLRAAIPQSDTLIVHDRNSEATAKFVQEVGAGIEVASSPRSLAEKSVSTEVLSLRLHFTSSDEYDISISMI